MTERKAKKYALRMIFAWASVLGEGVDDGTFGDYLTYEIEEGEITESDAKKIQRYLNIEASRLHRRIYGRN